MKQFIKFMMGVILFTLILAGLQSCNGHRPRIPIDDQEFQDKLDQFLPEALKNVYAFSDITDVIIYKQERSTQNYIDSVFLTMTDQEVANVVAVLKKQQSSFGVSDIVYEYTSNRRIYGSLPDNKKEEPDPPVAKPESDSTTQLVQYGPFNTD
jgi:hypothetical protein